MNKAFSNFILKYSTYFVILYLLYDNKIQLKSIFFNSYIQILLLILIVCFAIEFIRTKTKFYYILCFFKYIFPIFFITILFLFLPSGLLGVHNFIIGSFLFIVVVDIFLLLLKDKDFYYIVFEFSNLVYIVIIEFLKDNKILIDKLIMYKDTSNIEILKVMETDEAIKNIEDDALGRKDFIEELKTIFKENLDLKKGNVFGLFGEWGEGKSSIIYLLEQVINKNDFKFIFINPWFNDTKEKMLNAVFGELNNFAKTNYPYKSFESDFDEIIKLSNVKLGSIELAFDKFTDDKNIQHKIENIGKILKEKYLKRIVLILDDIDRLNKDNILFILQIVKMFKEYTNIIFILSCNHDKVQQILCEVSDPCVQKDNNIDTIRKTAYYEDFLDKIITIPIDIPKIEYFFIIQELIKKLNIVVTKQKIYKNDLTYISTKVFKTIRDIKRFYNYFLVMYKLVDIRIDIYNFINISILNVFYPDLYKNAYINKSQWFDIEFWKKSIFGKDENNNKNNTEILKEDINNYFKNLINKYDDTKQNILKEILFLVSPTYNFANKTINYNKTVSSTETSYFRDKSFLSAYFIQYNFTIILNEKIKEWYKINE